MNDLNRAAEGRLVSLIETQDPFEQSLPLVHTTDAYRFVDVSKTGSLIPAHCEVFDEELLYFFVGKPAYRTRRQNNSNLRYDLPITLIMRPDADLPTPTRIFPFDTGAFDAGFYSSHFHRDTKPEDLCLGSDFEMGLKYAAFFYRDNSEYFLGHSTKNVDIPYGAFEAEGLFSLAREPADPSATARISADERSTSIEIQFQDPVSLSKNVLGVIAPQIALDHPETLNFIRTLNPDHLESYEVIDKMGTEGIAASIYHAALKIYRYEEML